MANNQGQLTGEGLAVNMGSAVPHDGNKMNKLFNKLDKVLNRFLNAPPKTLDDETTIPGSNATNNMMNVNQVNNKARVNNNAAAKNTNKVNANNKNN